MCYVWPINTKWFCHLPILRFLVFSYILCFPKGQEGVLVIVTRLLYLFFLTSRHICFPKAVDLFWCFLINSLLNDPGHFEHLKLWNSNCPFGSSDNLIPTFWLLPTSEFNWQWSSSLLLAIVCLMRLCSGRLPSHRFLCLPILGLTHKLETKMAFRELSCAVSFQEFDRAH